VTTYPRSMTQQIQSGLLSNADVIIDLTEEKNTKNEKKYLCQFCDKAFQKKSNFDKHISYHKKNQRFSFVRLTRPEDIIIDLTEEEEEGEEDQKKYLCRVCDKKFKEKRKFVKHKNFHKVKQCQYCSKTMNKRKLKDHEKIHNKIKDRNRCNFCNQTFNQKLLQKKHEKTYHPKVKLELET